jgi:hypothetical protein
MNVGIHIKCWVLLSVTKIAMCQQILVKHPYIKFYKDVFIHSQNVSR